MTENIQRFQYDVVVIGAGGAGLRAAIEARLAGAKTAVIAGLVVWFVTMMAAFADVVLGITPANLLVIGGAWSLVETIVAAVAGAWVYKEA